jgi:XRE family transcriptional regulator, regulator of sulfur utilization
MPKSERRNPDAARFGAVIRRLRKERGWTIVKLSRRCGMNPTYLGVLESGGNMLSIETLLELADVLNTPASEIVREVEEARKAARARHAAAAKATES